jgi:hypothetical protein
VADGRWFLCNHPPPICRPPIFRPPICRPPICRRSATDFYVTVVLKYFVFFSPNVFYLCFSPQMCFIYNLSNIFYFALYVFYLYYFPKKCTLFVYQMYFIFIFTQHKLHNCKIGSYNLREN